MSSPPLHRMFHHYSEMPYSQRVLFTATLLVIALGYLFALSLIFVTYAGRAGEARTCCPIMISLLRIREAARTHVLKQH